MPPADHLVRHALEQLVDAVSYPDRLAVLSDYLYLFSTNPGVFDGHAKQPEFVLLILGGKGILMQPHMPSQNRAASPESLGRGWLLAA
jgi:hypothetical protein